MEEIEKTKIEEIKLKSFKNTDKLSKQQPRQFVTKNASNQMNNTLTNKFSAAYRNQEDMHHSTFEKTKRVQSRAGTMNTSIEKSQQNLRENSPQLPP